MDWKTVEPQLREALGLRFHKIRDDGTLVTNGKLSPTERRTVEALMPKGEGLYGTGPTTGEG